MLTNIRKKISHLTRWQTRSVAEQKRIALFLFILAVILPVFAWLWINAASSENLRETAQVIQRYERALPLAARITQARPDMNETAGLSPLAAAQQVARDMGIEDNLTSIRPSRALQGREGVQVHIENLNLPQLLHLFESLKNQAQLQIISGNLNKKMDNPEQMDLSLVLAR